MDTRELDRLTELANIGAGHAATAFSRLSGREIRMQVPRVRARVLSAPALPDPDAADDDWSTGVFFEFEGYLAALVGILFRAEASEALVRAVTGQEDGQLDPHLIESALMEVGNILASHVASAIADTVGVRLLPSIPTLSLENADADLAAHVASRSTGEHVRIECELTDARGELGGLLVLIPDGFVVAKDIDGGSAAAPVG